MAIDPDVQVLLDVLVARIAALETAVASLTTVVPAQTVKPDRVVEFYPDGTEVTFQRV